MANFCSECGIKLNGVKFCPECGTKVATSNERAPSMSIDVGKDVSGEMNVAGGDINITSTGELKDCAYCNGTGRVNRRECTQCSGFGFHDDGQGGRVNCVECGGDGEVLSFLASRLLAIKMLGDILERFTTADEVKGVKQTYPEKYSAKEIKWEEGHGRGYFDDICPDCKGQGKVRI